VAGATSAAGLRGLFETEHVVRRTAEGASVIDCWWTSCNSFAWYSLRLNLRPTVLASTRSINHEESQLSNRHCRPSGKSDTAALIRHGFHKRRFGKRRRYQCQAFGKTFCSTTRTPYYRLQHRRANLDEVISLSVEGLNKSAIARVKRVAWNNGPSLAGKSSRLRSTAGLRLWPSTVAARTGSKYSLRTRALDTPILGL
jgi:transposase-like protein